MYNEYDEMDVVYDMAIEALGFTDIKSEPMLAKYAVKASIKGAASAFIPGQGFKKSFQLGIQAGKDCEIDKIAWEITKVLKQHESALVGLINQIRKSMNQKPFDPKHDASGDKKFIQKALRNKKPNHQFYVYHIDVLQTMTQEEWEKNGKRLRKPKDSPIFNTWNPKMQKLLKSMDFSNVLKGYDGLVCLAEFDEDDYAIEIAIRRTDFKK